MVVSHRESSISSNIRAIIEQLNLNPVERRRLIESRSTGDLKLSNKQHIHHQHQQQKHAALLVESVTRPRVTIGVYGLRQLDNNKNLQERSIGKIDVQQQHHHGLQSLQSIKSIQSLQSLQSEKRKVVRRVEARTRQRIPPRLELDEVAFVESY